VVSQDCRCIAAVAGRVVEIGHIGCRDCPWEGTYFHHGMVRNFDFDRMAHSCHMRFHMPPHTVDIDVACLGFDSSLAGSCMPAAGAADMAFPALAEHTLVVAAADLGHYAAVPVLFLPPEAAAIWEALFSAGRESAAGTVVSRPSALE